MINERLSHLRCSALLAISLSLVGCSATLVNKLADKSFKDPKGVPWVESREYDVYVHAIVDGPKGGATDKLIHYGRYNLGDKVNGTIIDKDRRWWVTNYKAGIFSDGNLSLVFHENGSLKEARVTLKANPAEAVQAVTAALSVTDEIQKKELERLKRQKELQDARKALEEVEQPADESDSQ